VIFQPGCWQYRPATEPIRSAGPTPPPPYPPLIRILLLCTANICRSPIAAAFLGRELEELGVDADVVSAGRLPGGRPTTPENLEVMRHYGVDLTAHRSQRATPELVRDADLILGMAREHVRDAIGLAPDAIGRTFTLKELARRGRAIGARPDHQPLRDWLASAAAARPLPELLGSSEDDDVEDPMGGPVEEYEACASTIREYAAELAALAWGSVAKEGRGDGGLRTSPRKPPAPS
jgi:protein-tyrosine phosphatase